MHHIPHIDIPTKSHQIQSTPVNHYGTPTSFRGVSGTVTRIIQPFSLFRKAQSRLSLLTLVYHCIILDCHLWSVHSDSTMPICLGHSLNGHLPHQPRVYRCSKSLGRGKVFLIPVGFQESKQSLALKEPGLRPAQTFSNFRLLLGPSLSISHDSLFSSYLLILIVWDAYEYLGLSSSTPDF